MRRQRGRWLAKSRVGAVIAVLLAAACNDVTQPPSSLTHQSTAVNPPETGYFQVLWGDGQTPAESRQLYVLADDHGRMTHLQIEDALLRRHGGPRALNHKRVKVDGDEIAPHGRGPRELRVRSLSVEEPNAASSLVSGTKPYVTLLCKFSDSNVEPQSKATYASWMGNSYGGLDHTWREISYNLVNMAGSVVEGWFAMPHPRSHYVHGDTTNLGALLEDCTGAADADVFFPDYAGINLQFNLSLGCCSWGTLGPAHFTIDGALNQYGITWMADWAAQGIYSHEIGHSFGLPHSSGPYGNTYDSHWDVMSTPGIWVPALARWLGQHTISYHKDLLGWIPAERRLAASPGTTHTITLERTALPPTGNYLMATIPIAAAPEQFYTVEARGLVGYDTGLPGSAIVLHRVDPAFGWTSPARVVDVDNNGNVNDAGAMWIPGETFTDAANGISVTVLSATATGFRVSISNWAAAPAGLSATPSATAVKLKWQDTPYETSYQIRRAPAPEGGPEGAFSPLGNVAQNITTFVDGTAVPGTRYHYRVRACNADGCTPYASAFSMPVAPAAFAADTSWGKLVLSWTDTSGETEYRIQRALAPEGAALGANLALATLGANSTTFTDSTAESSTRYRYRIRACNGGGCSNYAYAFATTPAAQPTVLPPAVTGFLAGLGSGTVLLNWTDGPDEYEYVVQRALAPEGGTVGSFSLVGRTAANQTSLVDAGVAPSTRYRYRMRACNNVGCSGYVHRYVTTPGPPAPPAGLKGVPNNGYVTVSWTLAAFESSYHLQRAPAPEGGSIGPNTVIAELGATTTTYADTSADPGARYRYRLRTCDGWGCSSFDYFYIYTLPNVITNAALGIMKTSFSMQGYFRTNGVSFRPGFEWGTSAALSSYFSTSLLAPWTSNVSVGWGLGSLSCNTAYYYRAVAVLASGTVVRGAIIPVTTLPC